MELNDESSVPNENISWWMKRQKNRPQERALIAGILLMINNGLNISWSLFNNHFNTQIWVIQSNYVEMLIVLGSWYLGAIIGSFNSGYFIDSLGRRKVMRIGIIAQLIGALILIFFSTGVIGLMFGRLICGYGSACGYLALIAYAGEISTKYNRGVITSFIHLGNVLGILIFTILNPFTINYEELDLVFIIGIITGSLAVIALPFNFWFSYESPVYLIGQNLDSDALESMIRLNNARLVTPEIRDDFQSMQRMVIMDRRKRGSIFKLPALYFLMIMKLILFAIFNYPLNYTRIEVAENTIGSINDLHFQTFILAILRVCFSVAVLIMVDAIGRVPIMLWSIRTSAISLIILTIGYMTSTSSVQAIFNIAFEVFSSFGISMIVDIYSTEVFTTFKKGIGLSLANAFVNLLHMILLIVGAAIGIDYIFSYTVLILFACLLAIAAFMKMPETKRQSLEVTTDKFNEITLNFQLW